MRRAGRERRVLRLRARAARRDRQTAAPRDFLCAVVIQTGHARPVSWTRSPRQARRSDRRPATTRPANTSRRSWALCPPTIPLVCLVLIDESKKGYYGGDIAAPCSGHRRDVHRLRDGPLSPRARVVQVAASDLKPPPRWWTCASCRSIAPPEVGGARAARALERGRPAVVSPDPSPGRRSARPNGVGGALRRAGAGAERPRAHAARSAQPSLGALDPGARLGQRPGLDSGSGAGLSSRGGRRLSPDLQEREQREARVADRGTAEWGTVSEPWRASGF